MLDKPSYMAYIISKYGDFIMNKAFGYIRVSGKGQIKGDGLTRQEKKIREFTELKGIEITEILREIISQINKDGQSMVREIKQNMMLQ